MLTFDKVPLMDREAADRYFSVARSFAVWVQVNPALQRLVPISKADAVDLVYDGLKFGYVWGQVCEGCLELSLTSQWMSRIYEIKEKRDEGLQQNQSGRQGSLHPCS